MTKEEYMKIALDEEVKGMGFTSPNPMVGAVIVKDGRIISRDYHHRCGEFHAERNAINNCMEDMHGAEIYVTLEPCCHYVKTPPCTEAIIQSGIKVEEIGSISAVKKGAKETRLVISGEKIFSDLKIGDSVAVNGVCLTAAEINDIFLITTAQYIAVQKYMFLRFMWRTNI